jgi:hypothetical protein
MLILLQQSIKKQKNGISAVPDLEYGGAKRDRTADLYTARVHHFVIAGYRKVSKALSCWDFAVYRYFWLSLNRGNYRYFVTGLLP